jgi:hypothetical protein
MPYECLPPPVNPETLQAWTRSMGRSPALLIRAGRPVCLSIYEGRPLVGGGVA